jgi:hypothetical protein
MVVLHSRKPLLARGISLSSEEIAAKGRTFFYPLEAWPEGRDFLYGPRPDLNDATVYIQTAPMLY